jgi:TetR/AcrR family transcriptional repressor of nem operon
VPIRSTESPVSQFLNFAARLSQSNSLHLRLRDTFLPPIVEPGRARAGVRGHVLRVFERGRLGNIRIGKLVGKRSRTARARERSSMSTELAANGTSGRILDIAERLVQTRGFNAFSYADIAAALNITKASLHYHFPTKAKLGERLVERYQESFVAALARIDESSDDAGARLRAYVGIYSDVLDNDRMCLCGMLAADYATLPDPVKHRVVHFFDINEAWLTSVLLRGRASKQLAFSGPPVERAGLIVGALEGAMLLARSHGDHGRFRAVAARVLADCGVEKRRRSTAAR